LSEALPKKVLRAAREFERGAVRRNVTGVDAQLEIARQRLFEHDARDRWSISSALANDERDVGEIVVLGQHQTLYFARDRANLGVAIAAFEITNLTASDSGSSETSSDEVNGLKRFSRSRQHAARGV
jgi:hypothetical protein